MECVLCRFRLQPEMESVSIPYKQKVSLYSTQKVSLNRNCPYTPHRKCSYISECLVNFICFLCRGLFYLADWPVELLANNSENALLSYFKSGTTFHMILSPTMLCRAVSFAPVTYRLSSSFHTVI